MTAERMTLPPKGLEKFLAAWEEFCSREGASLPVCVDGEWVGPCPSLLAYG
jgi:hypothetical protein